MKYFTANVDQDGVLTFPEDFIKDQDWREGDELTFKVELDTIILINRTKEERERRGSR